VPDAAVPVHVPNQVSEESGKAGDTAQLVARHVVLDLPEHGIATTVEHTTNFSSGVAVIEYGLISSDYLGAE